MKFKRRTFFRAPLAAFSALTLCGLSAAVLPAAVLPTAVLPAATALPTPLSPQDSQIAAQWVNPAARPDELVDSTGAPLIDISLKEIGGASHSQLAMGQPLRLSVQVSNHSDQDLRDLNIYSRRAEAATTTGQLRRILSLPRSDYLYFGPSYQANRVLRAGETLSFDLVLPTAFGEEDSLNITDPGVYPLLLSAMGQLGPSEVNTHLGTERTSISMGSTDAAGEDNAEQVPGLSFVVPLSAPVDIVAGETGTAPEETPLILASEQLAEDISAEGRLYQVLREYRTHGDSSFSCLALDPMLIDAISRMSTGYEVAQTRPALVEKAQRLRDSWSRSKDTVDSEPGRGVDAAQVFLQELREATQEGCVMALPWADADINAVAATQDQWLIREALGRGPAVLEEVLGATALSNVVLIESGYLNERTAPALGWADTSTLSDPVSSGSAPSGSAPSSDIAEEWEARTATMIQEGLGEEERSALESTDLPLTPTPAPLLQEEVRVLIADNTTWNTPKSERFRALSPAHGEGAGLLGVTYPATLGAIWQTTGPTPQTTGYSNPETRFNYALDSTYSRALNASSALRVAVGEQTLPGFWEQSPAPILGITPSSIDAQSLNMMLGTAQDLLSSGAATPLSLDAYLTPSAQQRYQLGEQINLYSTSAISSTAFGSPYPDPAEVSDAEVLRARQQARYLDDLTRMMLNDPAIALSRYQFTLPLRRDVLNALSTHGRMSYSAHNDSVARTDTYLDANRQILQELRGSVQLLPPGNVYTRASESSPLLIVAENGLPLPVDARLVYSGPDNTFINVPESIRIPAHGSITVQMTADLPVELEQTQIRLWLATHDGSPISAPVEITVQTRTGIVGTYGLGLLVVVGLSLALLFRVGRRRRQQQARMVRP